MRVLPDQSSVIYRTGLTDQDYDEAIEALQDAKKWRGNESHGCAICCSSDHTAEHCHHNPLVMARRAALAVRVWRCFHCDAVFTDAEKAAAHFGTREAERPACYPRDIERMDWIEKQSNGSPWVARQSGTGRGFRLHNTGEHLTWARGTARDAIDAAMAESDAV